MPLSKDDLKELGSMSQVHGLDKQEEEDTPVTDPSKMPAKGKGDEEPADGQAKEGDEGEKEQEDERPAEGSRKEGGEEEDGGEEDDKEYGKKVQKRIARETRKRREVERQLAELQAAFDEERRLRSHSQAQVTTSQEATLKAHDDRLKADRERLRREYRDAAERGDVEKQFDIEEQIADVRVELKRNEYLRGQAAAAKGDGENQQGQGAPAARPQPSKKALAWADENKEWFGQNRVMTAAALGIDADLKEEGYDHQSDDYYAELSRRMREEFPHKFPKRSHSSPVAAGQRQSGNTGKAKAKPTQGQRDMAARLGVPIDTYMKYVPRE